ncbi:MAG: ribonuclease D [Actinomycetota bacterium]|nr:ribonuclease D [Actinomycetota bacterium]
MTDTCELLRDDLDEAFASRFGSAGCVAWDIETSGLDPRTDHIGTAQLHAPGLGTVIVQVGAVVPQRLCRLLADPAVRKVFHHAMFDLRFMVAHWDAQPARIACTKIASKLLSPQLATNCHSLQSLLASYLGVEISKAQRLTDWLAPELTAAQLAYASRDVAYLIPLLGELEQRLRTENLVGMYQACLDFLPTRVRLELGDWPDVFAY